MLGSLRFPGCSCATQCNFFTIISTVFMLSSHTVTTHRLTVARIRTFDNYGASQPLPICTPYFHYQPSNEKPHSATSSAGMNLSSVKRPSLIIQHINHLPTLQQYITSHGRVLQLLSVILLLGHTGLPYLSCGGKITHSWTTNFSMSDPYLSEFCTNSLNSSKFTKKCSTKNL